MRHRRHDSRAVQERRKYYDMIRKLHIYSDRLVREIIALQAKNYQQSEQLDRLTQLIGRLENVMNNFRYCCAEEGQVNDQHL